MLASRSFALILLLVTCLYNLAEATDSQPYCKEKAGIKICVSYRGSSSVSALVPEETTAMKIDIFYVCLENDSPKAFTVTPSDFSCVSMTDEAVTVDEPLHEKIKWSKKLSRTAIKPGEKIEGYIFCPGTKHPIRSIVYHGETVIEISLF